MDQAESDLFLLLDRYATRHNNAVIVTGSFVQSVLKAIQQRKTNIPGIKSFLDNTQNEIHKALEGLIKAELVFEEEGNREKIYFPSLYSRKIGDAYEHIDTSIETPLPNDTALSIYNLQKHRIKHVDVLNGFIDYINKRDEENKREVIRLAFFEGYDSALAVSELLPQKILRISLFKLCDYLKRYGNAEFFLEKLKNHFPGKETLVQDYFKNITTAPEKSIAAVMSGGSFSTTFWPYLCSLLKSELQHQEVLSGERPARDIALYQVSSIILACNNYYTTVARDERDKSFIFSLIDGELEKPPYYYSFDNIKSFKTNQGQNILRNFSVRDLTAHIKKKLKSENNNTMPALLTFHGPSQERWYVSKKKAADLCRGLIAEAAPVLEKHIEDRWRKIIKNYYNENTMRSDSVFEELVYDLAMDNIPHLPSILREPKLEFVLDELRAGGEQLQLELFRFGKPLPLHKMLGLEREKILLAVRADLPLRHSIKFIAKLIGFLKHGTKSELIFAPKKQRNRTVQAAEDGRKDNHTIDNLAKSLLPEGETMESELDILAEKWDQLIDKSAREILRKKVDVIIRSKFIFEFNTLKFGSLTVSILADIAVSLIASNDVLKSIHDKKALQSYITLYMLKLIKAKGLPILKKT
jgi:hypothetical protein